MKEALNLMEGAVPFEDFKVNDQGLIPCIVQDAENGDVLMMAWMNEESYGLTLKTGVMTYWTRSRQQLWVKGETSGHYQYVKELCIDCDCDTLLAKVDQVGAACHTGNRSCFYRRQAWADDGTQYEIPSQTAEKGKEQNL